MAVEIERKFLVKSADFKKESYDSYAIRQGYISSSKNATVRIRITANTAFITIKGKSNVSGTSRYEWEKEIDLEEAEALFLLCQEGVIEKERFLIQKKGHVFEVDEFFGENKGLFLAEVELKAEDQDFEKPSWLGKEVTGNLSYYNSYLSKHPFKRWS